MTQPLSSIRVKNFRSLGDAEVDLGPFTVLVGPNGSGKTNLLRVLSFIRDSARFDIDNTLQLAGGYERVHRQAEGAGPLEIEIECQVTRHSSAGAPDAYRLRLNETRQGISRTETLNFKRVSGPGKRITVRDTQVSIEGEDGFRLASRQTSGLGAIARLSRDSFGDGPADFVTFLSSIRTLDPDVELARQPGRITNGQLDDLGSNLASALFNLKRADDDAFEALESDMSRCLTGLEGIELVQVGGSSISVVVQLHERGVTRPIDLADASFGTVRLLTLLTALHEPDPPALTVIEEVDHGLHPYALDILVDRMRAASSRTQIMVASHSPTLVNRLEPDEIIVCDRDIDTGESLIPAISSEEIADALGGTDLRAGELWFAGALDGVPR